MTAVRSMPYISALKGRVLRHESDKGYINEDVFILMRKIKLFEIDELGLKINIKTEEI